MEFTGGYLEPIMDSLYDATEAMLRENGFRDVSIIFATSGAPVPKNTYVVLDILEISQVGRSDESTYLTAEEKLLEFNTHYKIDLRIAVRGDSAPNIASSLHHNINNRRCFEELMKRNLGVLNKSSLRRAPQLRETQWVEGYNFDLTLTFSVFTRQSYDWVEYISINGEVFKVPYKE